MPTDRLAQLERNVRALQSYAAVLTLILAGIVLAAFRSRSSDDQIVRARGLVIVDAEGRERILIGAPIPGARNRVRTDTARVRAIWGRRFPREYMEYYNGYRHDVNGILVLDANGFDRVALGDSVPDPNIGRRIGSEAGILINDAEGFERSAWGLLNVKGRYRTVLGLDDNHGGEGVSLAVIDSGAVGITTRVGDQTLYLGTAPPNDSHTQLTEPFHGLLIRKGGGVRRIGMESN
jgi:hypothetical protein